MMAEQVSPSVYRLRTMLVNVYFVKEEAGASSRWALVDTGLRGCARLIHREAERLFQCAPSAILLTHGHFDHVGGLPALADTWRAPIYAHPLELPYLTGRSAYPPPDPSVGGGAMARLSPLYPRGPIDLGLRIHMLPENGVVPGLSDWQWLRTDGHAPGHVSFFRPADRTLIAGDAVVATRQESLIHVLLQTENVSRPPAYYTPDWEAARSSVERIAALDPEVLATGHGHVLRGAPMREALHHLAEHFDEAMPSSGRYVPYPAITDGTGVIHLPPRPATVINPAAWALGAVILGLGTLALRSVLANNRSVRARKAASGGLTATPAR